MFERGLRRVKRADQIDLDDGLEAVRRERGCRREEVAGRAVDDRVERTEAFDRRAYRFCHVVRVPDVRRNGEDLATGRRGELGRGLLEYVGFAADDADIRAQLSVGVCDAAA